MAYRGYPFRRFYGKFHVYILVAAFLYGSLQLVVVVGLELLSTILLNCCLYGAASFE